MIYLIFESYKVFKLHSVNMLLSLIAEFSVSRYHMIKSEVFVYLDLYNFYCGKIINCVDWSIADGIVASTIIN